MPLPEICPVPDEFRIVVPVLDGTTRRDVARADRFRGLSAADASLLGAWCGIHGHEITELHTDIAIGEVPVWGPAEQAPAWERLATACHPLRIDAVARYLDQWWLLECKPDAGYVALGQLLTYGFYAIRVDAPLEVPSAGVVGGRAPDQVVDRGCLADARLGVVTDQVQRCVRPVFERYGIEVFQVGAILDQGEGV